MLDWVPHDFCPPIARARAPIGYSLFTDETRETEAREQGEAEGESAEGEGEGEGESEGMRG